MKNVLKIEGRQIKEYGNPFIIAEAGVNHNQRLDYALQLIDIAANAGADAVKFQTFKAEQVVTEAVEMAEYQKRNLGVVEGQIDMLRKLELPESFYPKIIKRCKEKHILFLSTPHGGKSSVDFLEKFGVQAYKIGSGDLTNYILLNRVAKTGKPIILSSGMATMKEVKAAINFIKSKKNKQIAVLHCTTNYPCPPEEVNLSAMQGMMKLLDIPVGYSDHTNGVQTAIMAATMGMALYECHFTIDKNLPGPDHIASCTPDELKERVQAVRLASVILGSSKKVPNKSESESMLELTRRSVVAAHDLKAGHIVAEEDLEAKRPGNGISPARYEIFIGKTLKHSLRRDQQLQFSDISK